MKREFVHFLRFKLYFKFFQVYWGVKQYSTLAESLKHFQKWPDDFRDFLVQDLICHNKLSSRLLCNTSYIIHDDRILLRAGV